MGRDPNRAPFARLKKRADFLHCAQGKRANAPGLTVQVQSGSETRIGFTVSKKNGNSVKRNRIRRRLKAAVEQLAADAFGAADYVVVARPEALGLPFPALVKSLRNATDVLARKTGKPHLADKAPESSKTYLTGKTPMAGIATPPSQDN